MPLFLCRWPNGDLSVVYAGCEAAVRRQLDEIEDSSGPALLVAEVDDFVVHFRLPSHLKRDSLNAVIPPLLFDGFDDTTRNFLETSFYPEFSRAAAEVDLDVDPPLSEVAARRILQAGLARERGRLAPAAARTAELIAPKRESRPPSALIVIPGSAG
jgi:hypothetical protein